MESKEKGKWNFKAGMYLLETLTSGMYNDPLSVFREYVQNAVDSIDLGGHGWERRKAVVHIDLDPKNRRITIFDNGIGLPASLAKGTLSSIGDSSKTDNGLRGFRGIGRLGGIGFAERAIFRTKARGEKVETVQEWDCRELRKLISQRPYFSLSLNQLLRRITSFHQENNKNSKHSYFQVTLEGVSSFRNCIFDIWKVRNYLSKVAPVPFNKNKFGFAKEIEAYLSKNINHYGRYEIKLNGEQIHKPYQDRVRLTKGGFDLIENVRFFELKAQDTPIAYGWYGERRGFLGAIVRGDPATGISARVGDIMIGDSHLLDKCYREARFNSYMIGEVHAVHPELIPNSRRDDFVDNEMKALFYNAFEREIGIPISKKIRLRSRTRSRNATKLLKPNEKENGNNKLIQKINPSSGMDCRNLIDELNKTCNGCPKLAKIITKIGCYAN